MNPISLEQHIFARHAEIEGAIVAGSRRFQAALLLELAGQEQDDKNNRAEVIEKIWPPIEEANRACPAHARIMRSHILFTLPQRPMSRSSKGTIQRAATLKEYAKELNTLYEAADIAPFSNGTSVRASLRDMDGVISYLKVSVLDITGRRMADDDNFFVQGMDSLQALILARALKSAFNKPDVTTSMIYRSPTMVLLAKALRDRARTYEALDLSDQPDRHEIINTMIEKYIDYVDHIPLAHRTPTNEDARIVLLTGSTGVLGSYLLQTLLASHVAHMCCFDRGIDGHSRQTEKSGKLGLTTKFTRDRVTFIDGDLSKAQLGLEPKLYSDLMKSVTEIIHNAWPVSFNHPLSTFEPQIEGVVNLVRFASSAQHSPSFLYVSSISAVSSLRTIAIPEESVHDPFAPAQMGYGESKYVAEQILDHATKKLHLKTKIARVGQIAGPLRSSGEWNRNEWFPSLVRSSLHLGIVPGSLGPDLDRIDWIPIDSPSQVIIELMWTKEQGIQALDGHAEVYNLLNLHPVKWGDLQPTVVATLSSIRIEKGEGPATTSNLASWLQTCQEKMETQRGVTKVDDKDVETLLELNPAFKLLEFYETASSQPPSSWETQKAQHVSKVLRELEGIKEEWLVKWMKSWLG